MATHPAGRRPVQLTLRQLQILVLYAAATMACLMPIGQADASFRPAMMIVAALALPLAWSIVTLLVVRRGPVQDCAVSTFLAIEFLVILGYITFVIVRSWLWGWFRPESLLLELACVVPLLLFARRAIPRRCPSCRRPALVRDKLVDASDASGPLQAHHCLACGARAWRGPRCVRERLASTEAVDSDIELI